jgi:hypothetical protein
LPPISPPGQVIDLFAQYPEFDKSQKDWPNHLRMHCVYQLKEFLQPLPLHIDMETRFSVMIRQGYTARNPLFKESKRLYSIGINKILEAGCNEQGYNLAGNRPSAGGFCIIGPSGIGKSTAVEKILLSYP